MLLSSESSSLAARPNLPPPRWVVVIGGNTGGPQALTQLLPQFPTDFAGAIVVVQLMRAGFTRVLVDQLSQVCSVPVCEPEDGQALQAGRIMVAPASMRLTLANVGTTIAPAYSVLLEQDGNSPEARYSRINAAMESAAKLFGQRSAGVLLSGLGSDGREGMRSIRDAGGITIVQDEATSVVHAMPSAAMDAGVVQEMLPLWSIAERIATLAGGDAHAAAA